MRNLAGEAFVLMTRLDCSVELLFLFDSSPEIQVSDDKLLCLVERQPKELKSTECAMHSAKVKVQCLCA
jgi:hypothetical protein